MPISRSGRADDSFLDELAKLMPKPPVVASTDAVVEDKLAEDRKEKDQEAETEKITDKQLAEDRPKDPVPENYEGMLEKSRKESKAAAPNVDKEGITEQRLNESSKDQYPHRNEKAYERTGDKRPVNALREEMGNASDEAKNERYEKANKPGKARIVDKDMGKQAFNLKKQKIAIQNTYQKYIAYKTPFSDVKTASVDKFAEVKNLDTAMASLMESAQKENRELSHDDLAKIAAMKQRKSEILLG